MGSRLLLVRLSLGLGMGLGMGMGLVLSLGEAGKLDLVMMSMIDGAMPLERVDIGSHLEPVVMGLPQTEPEAARAAATSEAPSEAPSDGLDMPCPCRVGSSPPFVRVDGFLMFGGDDAG